MEIIHISKQDTGARSLSDYLVTLLGCESTDTCFEISEATVFMMDIKNSLYSACLL